MRADREFVGRDGFGFLLAHRIPFRLRLTANVPLTSTRGTSPLVQEFQDLRLGQSRVLRQPRRLWGHGVFLSAQRLEDGDGLLIARDSYAHPAVAE